MVALSTLARRAGDALQDIQLDIGDQSYASDAVVRFPRGYVRTTAAIYADLPAIGDHTKRRNLAYQLMMADVCRWLLSRTDVYGQIRSVIVSDYICILGFGAEFYVKTLNFRKVGKGKPFKEHTTRLVSDGLIGTALKDELDWIWSVRTHEHLDATSSLLHCTHGNRDFNRAFAAWNDFLAELRLVF